MGKKKRKEVDQCSRLGQSNCGYLIDLCKMYIPSLMGVKVDEKFRFSKGGPHPFV